jgi:hypothetical protein
MNTTLMQASTKNYAFVKLDQDINSNYDLKPSSKIIMSWVIWIFDFCKQKTFSKNKLSELSNYRTIYIYEQLKELETLGFIKINNAVQSKYLDIEILKKPDNFEKIYYVFLKTAALTNAEKEFFILMQSIAYYNENTRTRDIFLDIKDIAAKVKYDVTTVRKHIKKLLLFGILVKIKTKKKIVADIYEDSYFYRIDYSTLFEIADNAIAKIEIADNFKLEL